MWLLEHHIHYINYRSKCTIYEGNLEVLSMVVYLSIQFTNPIMFGIILKSYLSSVLWRKFHEDIIMQTRKYIILL